MGQRPRRQKGRLGGVIVVDRAKVVFAVFGIGAVIVPVVPDAQADAFGQIGQPLPGQILRLLFFGNIDSGVAPLRGDQRDVFPSGA